MNPGTNSLKSKVQSPKSEVCRRQAAAAFTLIELLVAMGILMVIVLMLANLFQASTRSWDTGMRQAEIGLEARAAINLIQQDLSQAVASSNRLFDAYNFSMLTGSSTNDAAIEQVRYTFAGGTVKRNDAELVRAVEEFSIIRQDSGGPDVLPDLVEITMVLKAQRDFSNVRVYVPGRGHHQENDPREVIDTHRGN